jgi:hypothetical protein
VSLPIRAYTAAELTAVAMGADQRRVGHLCCLCRRYHRLETHAPGRRYVMCSDGTLLVGGRWTAMRRCSDAITAERLT